MLPWNGSHLIITSLSYWIWRVFSGDDTALDLNNFIILNWKEEDKGSSMKKYINNSPILRGFVHKNLLKIKEKMGEGADDYLVSLWGTHKEMQCSTEESFRPCLGSGQGESGFLFPCQSSWSGGANYALVTAQRHSETDSSSSFTSALSFLPSVPIFLTSTRWQSEPPYESEICFFTDSFFNFYIGRHFLYLP